MKTEKQLFYSSSNLTKSLIIFMAFIGFVAFVIPAIIACTLTPLGTCRTDPCSSSGCVNYVETLEEELHPDSLMECQWYRDYIAGDGGVDGDIEQDTDMDQDADVDTETDGDSNTDGDTDQDTDPDGDEETCQPREELACSDEGDVVWLDSCGQPEEVPVEECLESHGDCRGGVCGCADGWTGESCERCLIYVSGSTGSDTNSGRSWTQALETVQAGLTAAELNGCEIWVAQGTYYPTDSSTDREATFLLRSGVSLHGGFDGEEWNLSERDIRVNETILNGDIDRNRTLDDGNVYHVVTGADDSIIDGFTITGGNANLNVGNPRSLGGGMFNEDAAPTVSNCNFYRNSASDKGGGMTNNSSSPVVTNCIFSGNEAYIGGGMYNHSSNPILTNCIFISNEAHMGGGMGNFISSPTITNCTFSENEAVEYGGGLRNHIESSPNITNSIFWGNTAPSEPQIHNRTEKSMAEVTHSDVQGGYEGEGNIDTDPLLDGSLRLTEGSPCIDSGDSSVFLDGATDLDGNPRIVDGDENGTEVVDMGAYEFDPGL